MTLSRLWPLAIYASVATAILWAANANNPKTDMLWVGVLFMLFGLQQMYDFLRSRLAIGTASADRETRPEAFWLVHALIQVGVLAMLCLPWLEKLGS